MTLVVLVALPLVAALLVLLLRGLPIIATPLTVVTLIALAILCLAPQQAEPLILFGRSLELLPLEAAGLAYCAALLALVILCTGRLSPGSWSHSLVLLGMSFFAAAVMVRNTILSGLLFEVGAVSAVMLVASKRPGAAMTSMRLLILLTLSGLLLLLAAWALESRAITPDDPLFANVGTVALALGFGIALALVPFHVWLPSVFHYGDALAAVMLGVVLSIVVLLRLNVMLQVSMWPGGRENLAALLVGSGTLTVFLGSLMAIPQRTVTRALAYAALADMGMVAIGLGLSTRLSFDVTLMHIAYRGLAILVVSASLGILRQCLDADDIGHLAGAVRRAPLAVMSMLIGGYSLAGMPLSAGFASRVLLYKAFSSQYAPWTLALALCSFGPAWAFTRCGVAALVSTPIPGGRREPLLSALLVFILALALLALGIYPNLLSLSPQEWLKSLSTSWLAWRG